ncbi:MAG: RnfH family protein [Tatlockia sp.]|nr:RnfH family protein [Tatlockia sp.]
MVQVELVFIPAEGPIVHLHLSVEPGATVADVLETSGIFKTNPEVKKLPVGIFSKQVALDSQIKSGDRIEIYRPLSLDPMEKRRQRAKAKR